MESSQKRLRLMDLRSKTLAFKDRIAIVFCDLKTSLGPGLTFRSFAFKKDAAFCVCILKPTKLFNNLP